MKRVINHFNSDGTLSVTGRQDQMMLYKLLVDFIIISYAKLYKLENATLET